MKMRVGVIGCGNISDIYLESPRKFSNLEIIACADIDLSRARAQAEKHSVPRAVSPAGLLGMDDVELVINLTVPAVHAEVAHQALEAGKHVYNEKPLAIELRDAKGLLELAASKNLRLGCAPDTVLGAGMQTCRKAVDDGLIGAPVAATAWMHSNGPDKWHPGPAFFFKHGAGPMFDMGPYYLTALVTLLGPVARVSSAARATFAERTAVKTGERIVVETPTLISAALEFQSGPIATLTTSFDFPQREHAHLEVHGTDGTLVCNDPNHFGGLIRVFKPDQNVPFELASSHPFAENSRGLGVAEMVHAIHAGRPHRASGELAYHVLEVMHASLESAREGRRVDILSCPARPISLPTGSDERILMG
jgi:predicted dehydrogenase